MTAPLSLVTPQGFNFIKDFPGQNAVNCDLLDAYAGPCLTSHPIQTWTPALVSSTGPANDPVLGTGGFTKGYYYKIFDQIHMWGEFRFGTASISAGSDIYCINIPFTIKTSALPPSTTIGAAPILGVGLTHDNSANAGRLPLTVHARTATQLYFGIRMNSGSSNRELRSAGYVTWDFQDGVSWSARFQQVG